MKYLLGFSLAFFLIYSSAQAAPFAFTDRAPAVESTNPLAQQIARVKKLIDLASEVAVGRELSERENSYLAKALAQYPDFPGNVKELIVSAAESIRAEGANPFVLSEIRERLYPALDETKN